MEKLNLVNRNGVVRLPPGFRFHPTDEELVVQYLKRKALSFPLPASIIPDVEVCKSDPWDLPGDSEQERYFFSTREAKYPNGNRSNRATGSGYWKATGIDKQILSSKGIHNNNTQIVGMKKTLVFYRGKPPHGSRTDWIMHEYRLVTTIPVSKHPNSNSPPHPQVDIAGMENWVLCRIFLKKRGSKNEEENRIGVEKQVMFRDKNNKPVLFYDFMTKERRADLNLAPSSPSSNLSGVTELSSSNDSEDHEDTSTCGNSLPNFSRKQT